MESQNSLVRSSNNSMRWNDGYQSVSEMRADLQEVL
jgi:hypothetical protein